MIEDIETLVELHKQGTMARAGHSLRVSQSAVSKRIASLEVECGVALVERVGRNVSLTNEGLDLIQKLGPLVQEIREELKVNFGQRTCRQNRIIIGVSESILSSWGAQALEEVFAKLGLEAEYHSHRSPLVIEKVESGIYDLGVCSGHMNRSSSVLSEALQPEEMVLVAGHPSQLNSKKWKDKILAIEKSSATWKSIKKDIENRGLAVVAELESFFSIAQLANVGKGVALVPLGVAKALGFKKNCIQSLRPKLYRPVQIVYKKSRLDRKMFLEMIKELKKL